MADKPPHTSLSTYLSDNHHLFTIIGIFSALTVYLGQLPVDSAERYIPVPDLAATAGFGLVLLISFVAIYDAIHRIAQAEHRITSIQNFPIGAFLCLFLILLLAISRALIQFEEAVATTSLVMVQLGALIIHVAFVYWLDRAGIVKGITNKTGRSRNTILLTIFSSYIVISLLVIGLLVIWAGSTDINSYRPSEQGLNGKFYILAISQFIAVGTRVYGLGLLAVILIRVYRHLSERITSSIFWERT